MAEQEKIDLNTASREELERLSEVSSECAQRIIEERQRRGGFQSISDLDTIGGPDSRSIRNLKAITYV